MMQVRMKQNSAGDVPIMVVSLQSLPGGSGAGPDGRSGREVLYARREEDEVTSFNPQQFPRCRGASRQADWAAADGRAVLQRSLHMLETVGLCFPLMGGQRTCGRWDELVDCRGACCGCGPGFHMFADVTDWTLHQPENLNQPQPQPRRVGVRGVTFLKNT